MPWLLTISFSFPSLYLYTQSSPLLTKYLIQDYQSSPRPISNKLEIFSPFHLLLLSSVASFSANFIYTELLYIAFKWSLFDSSVQSLIFADKWHVFVWIAPTQNPSSTHWCLLARSWLKELSVLLTLYPWFNASGKKYPKCMSVSFVANMRNGLVPTSLTIVTSWAWQSVFFHFQSPDLSPPRPFLIYPSTP